MKKILMMSASIHLLLASIGCVFAQQLPMRAVPITVQVYVHDPNGAPLQGANVHLSLPRYRLGDQNQWSDAITNGSGEAAVSGIAQQDYQIGADKIGFYHTTGPHRAIDTNEGFQKYASGGQKLDLELRPIRDPIASIAAIVDRKRLPPTIESVGFDLELSDWIFPYGKGKTADFIFKLEGSFTSQREYDQTLTLTFSNAGDGIILTKFPPRVGSAFKFPYEAPLAGYESQRAWKMRWSLSGGSSGSTVDSDGETNYLFRVRTELDDVGNVRRARYGSISGDLKPVGGNMDIGRNVSFSYSLNPTWTRNLEFDPAKIVRP